MSGQKYYVSKRVCVIGSMGVGKTTLITRLVEDKYSGDEDATVGAAYYSLCVTSRNIRLDERYLTKSQTDEVHQILDNPKEPERMVQIWDTAGDEKYRAVIPIYMRNCSLILICYEAGNPEAYEEVSMWRSICHENGLEDKDILVVATKEDLINRKKGGVYLMPDVMTSSLTGSGLEMLRTVIIYRTLRDTECAKPDQYKGVFEGWPNEPEQSKCC